MRYKAFGVSRFTSGTTPTTFRYTGQREDAGLGLYYYGARWYDPALGHFIQPDTLIPDAGTALDYHRYGYTKFNPLKYTDPTGHCGMSESAGESWSGPYGEACMGFSAGLSAGNKAALSAGGGFGLLTALNTGLASGSPPSQADPLPPPLEAVAGELSGATSTSFPLADGGQQTSIPPSTGVFNNTLNLLTEPLPSQQAGSNIVYGWKVGDPIDAPDANGAYPSWETARSRYWQNRAAGAYRGEFSPQNLGRMRSGDAPMVRIIARMHGSGEEVEMAVYKELHHIAGRGGATPHAESNLVEAWPWEHASMDSQRRPGYDFVRFK